MDLSTAAAVVADRGAAPALRAHASRVLVADGAADTLVAAARVDPGLHSYAQGAYLDLSAADLRRHLRTLMMECGIMYGYVRFGVRLEAADYAPFVPELEGHALGVVGSLALQRQRRHRALRFLTDAARAGAAVSVDAAVVNLIHVSLRTAAVRLLLSLPSLPPLPIGVVREWVEEADDLELEEQASLLRHLAAMLSGHPAEP